MRQRNNSKEWAAAPLEEANSRHISRPNRFIAIAVMAQHGSVITLKRF